MSTGAIVYYVLINAFRTSHNTHDLFKKYIWVYCNIFN